MLASERTTPATWWSWLTGGITVLAAAACGVVLWTFVPPTVFFPIFVLAAWVLFGLGIAWLVVALIGWFRFRAVRGSLAAPAVVVLTVGLVVFSVPSRVAFAVSENALTDLAATCEASFENRSVMVYRVQRTEPIGDGCLVYVEGGLIDSVGFAYLPGQDPYLGTPRRDGDIGYRPLHGDWYSFVEQF